ncbi:hypothetical protein EI555_018056, partial [Monodon monoceros]
ITVVGKSSIVWWFVENSFEPKISSTTGHLLSSTKTIDVAGNKCDIIAKEISAKTTVNLKDSKEVSQRIPFTHTNPPPPPPPFG